MNEKNPKPKTLLEELSPTTVNERQKLKYLKLWYAHSEEQKKIPGILDKLLRAAGPGPWLFKGKVLTIGARGKTLFMKELGRK